MGDKKAQLEPIEVTRLSKMHNYLAIFFFFVILFLYRARTQYIGCVFQLGAATPMRPPETPYYPFKTLNHEGLMNVTYIRWSDNVIYCWIECIIFTIFKYFSFFFYIQPTCGIRVYWILALYIKKKLYMAIVVI